MDLQRFMGFIKRKNMKFNVILPLKWQDTADIVAIPVDLKQETVSLLPRKSVRGICGTMIAYFQKGRGKKLRFLHYSKGQRDRLLSRRKRQKYNLKSDRDTDQSPVPHLGY